MEMLHIVHPETGEPVGRPMPRAEAIASGAWCRSTNVFVFNSQGHVLCHRRSPSKERLPGAWMTHLGGHVGAGETYETNARKELREEAGLFVGVAQLLPWRTTRIEHARLWAREFVTLADVGEDDLVPQPGEVEEFRWMTLDGVLRAADAAPEAWCAGTHDFRTEYLCMRAALNVGDAAGVLPLPDALRVWRPGLAV
ncbi:MAG TPA: NUDIX domain-containing protein [Candidatus Binatia bacterium]|jgi:isopentenyldiphosphate isomerase|nr:NUDIX domain-containing protein [Candidatus Binatia bacterium]